MQPSILLTFVELNFAVIDFATLQTLQRPEKQFGKKQVTILPPFGCIIHSTDKFSIQVTGYLKMSQSLQNQSVQCNCALGQPEL